ncbi:hypothetical protein [Marinobacterium rhizophilum]|nr:hypothetical protein [Marinobacterium rhizophilum]
MLANILKRLRGLMRGGTAPQQQPGTRPVSAPQQDLWRQAA